MKLIADLHTHTCASTHAFSTLHEMQQQAQKIGLQALAVTDHAIAVEDSPHISHFHTITRLPTLLPGNFLLLKGAEVNVLDTKGTVDLGEKILKKLDWVVASIHQVCVEPLSYQQATEAWLAVAQNPYVDMIGHSEEGRYLYNYDLVTQEFSKTGKVVEMNASSSVARPGNEENQRQLALACKKNGTHIAISSDAHSLYELGNWQPIIDMLEEIEFPSELVINTSMKRLIRMLESHGRDAARRIYELGYMGEADEQD